MIPDPRIDFPLWSAYATGISVTLALLVGFYLSTHSRRFSMETCVLVASATAGLTTLILAIMGMARGGA
jgi:hypothetical protein